TPPPEAAEVLLPYQRELLEATATNAVTVVEKSRRIGATWAVGADAVLVAGAEQGQDVFYVGYNQEMTREFIDTCATWAKAFLSFSAEVHEFLFKEEGPSGVERAIQAFRISFASGKDI